jgi:hypothetical protein
LRKKHLRSLKNEKNYGGQPPFQVHDQEAEHNSGFAGICQLGHDALQTVASFTLT